MSYFIQASNRLAALKECPECGWLIKVEGGYHAFDDYNDYMQWLNNCGINPSKQHLTNH